MRVDEGDGRAPGLGTALLGEPFAEPFGNDRVDAPALPRRAEMLAGLGGALGEQAREEARPRVRGGCGNGQRTALLERVSGKPQAEHRGSGFAGPPVSSLEGAAEGRRGWSTYPGPARNIAASMCRRRSLSYSVCFGTPSAYNGKVYMQTTRHLYCFGKAGRNTGVAEQAPSEKWPAAGPAAGGEERAEIGPLTQVGFA